MIKKLLVIFLLLGVSLASCKKQVKYQLVYGENQLGLITKYDKLSIDGDDVKTYKTISDNITLHYESCYVDENYNNTIKINDNYELKVEGKATYDFTKNSVNMLGLNIVNGKVAVNITSGSLSLYKHDNLNNFMIKNLYLEIRGKEVWPTNYTKEDYFNSPLAFGEKDMNPDLRQGYLPSRTFLFEVSEKELDTNGCLLDNNKSEFDLKIKKKHITLTNNAFITLDTNILDNEEITSTKQLEVTSNSDYKCYLDGILVPSNITFYQESLTTNNHHLLIVATNKYGFARKIERIFKEVGNISTNNKSDLTNIEVYNSGVSDVIYSNLDMGTKVDNVYDVLTSSEPVISFKCNANVLSRIVWSGESSFNTVYMEFFNKNTNNWEVVSVDNSEPFILSSKITEEYTIDSYVNVRIRCKNINLSLNVSDYVLHFTDVQYVVQKANSGKESIIGKKARSALTSISDYLSSLSNTKYISYTGDGVQSTLNIDEWNTFNILVVNPILQSNIPFGLSSGNHDVGGIASVGGGQNAFDDKLDYSNYYKYLNQERFSTQKSYYDGDENNKNHTDLITLNGKEVLFIYLGWSSDILGIHVNTDAINYAKTIIEGNADKIVILCTHDYLASSGRRTATGEYIYQTLVKKYNNIHFVLSGHVDGGSVKIDYLDDDGDSINDRRVLQLVSNFQEVEDLYGATFIRRLGFDYTNNLIKFDLYSPYIKDCDVFGQTNIDKTIESNNFIYYYDFGQSTAIRTSYIGD